MIKKITHIIFILLLIKIKVFGQSDNCLSAPSLPVNSSCVGFAYTITPAFIPEADPVSCVSSINNREDGWFIFTATSLSTIINATTNKNIALAVYSGPCGALIEIGCVNAGGTTMSETLTVSTTPGISYYLRMIRYNSGTSTNMTGMVCIYNPPQPSVCPGDLGIGVVNIGSLPFNSSGRTTCGKQDDINMANATICGNANFYQGEDEVFVFTPAASGNVSISLTSSAVNVGIMLYQSCPFTGQGGICINSSQSTAGNQSVCAYLNAGSTYHLLVDQNSTGCISAYSLNISAPAPPAQGSTCSAPVIISSLPYSISGQTTLCKGNDYSNVSLGSCASLYESGEDMVFRYTATTSQCIDITLRNTSSVYTGFQLYNGCPGTSGASCLGFVGGGDVSGTFSLPSAGTYYIIIDTWSSPSNSDFDLSITSSGSGPANDASCNAVSLPLGVVMNGNNGCASSVGEPNIPSCWTAGTLNTVWYSVAAPPSGMLKVRTILGTLINTQVAVYEGNCTALTQIFPFSVSCNNDATSCGLTTPRNSELSLTALIPGNTYFIRVDGTNSTTGTFGILALDGNGTMSLPPAKGQECGLPNPVCNSTITIGNPGFQSFGNNCDFTGGGSNCLLAGERGSAWYTIIINANGTLEFDIVPNDWPGSPSTVCTDYDFAIWNVKNGIVNCGTINSGSSAPLACNYDVLGITGLNGSGNSPPAYSGFNNAYEPALPVSNGDTMTLVISNFSGSASGFTIKFSSSSPINYNNSPAAVVWTGGVDNDWFKTENWGGCVIPSCSISAVIPAVSLNQPSINGGGATCKNLMINPSAILKINSGFTLSVCGDYTNNGSLIADQNATVVFSNGSVNQFLDGNLVGSNGFGNFTVDKTGGIVLLKQDADIKGNFLINNSSSIFDANGKTHRIAKNFTNGGAYLPGTSGSLVFNGASFQGYLNSGIVNIVTMNNSGGGISLLSNLVVGSTGFLNLLNGKIITSAFEVSVLNRTPMAVSSGSSLSYVEGNLRRSINPLGSYDFPVGNATKGYELATLEFTSPASIDNLLARFISWSSVPGPLWLNECGINYNQPALDNGYWSFTASNNPFSGIYNITLHNTNGSYTNAGSAFTVMQSPVNGSWGLYTGACAVSTIGSVVRNGLAGIYDFTTAQGQQPLPVELLSFEAQSKTKSITLNWSTASELNNKGFDLEKAVSPPEFRKIGWIEGQGSSTSFHSYQFEDSDVQPGIIYYYRLKQIDFNGSSHYSPVVAGALKSNEDFTFSAFPNPYHDYSVLSYSLRHSSHVTIEVLNSLGQKVQTLVNAFQETGNYRAEFSAKKSGYPAGIYTVRIIVDENVFMTRLMETQ